MSSRLALPSIPLTVALVFFLGGCVPKNSPTKNDIARLDSSLNDLRTLQAEHVAEISELQTQVRQLTGRLDEIEHSQSEKLGNLSSLKSDLSNLSRRVPPPPIVPAAALEADEALVPDLPLDIGQRFGQALQKIRSGAFQDATPLLQEALDLSFENKWAANVIFWQGIVAEASADPRRALGSYIDLVSRFPRHERTPLALYRQATVFIRLGDKKAANVTFRKLIAEFPRSGDAARAKERLKDLS